MEKNTNKKDKYREKREKIPYNQNRKNYLKKKKLFILYRRFRGCLKKKS